MPTAVLVDGVPVVSQSHDDWIRPTSFREVTVRSNRRIRWAAVPVAVGLVIALAGCSQQQLNGWLPGTGETKDVTNHTSRIVGLWTTSWIVLLAVGLIVWGLVIWAAIVYRRRKGQTGLPVQMRYNMPLEIFYTLVPLILVLGFFAFTAKDQEAIEKPFAQPDATVHVYGKRWGWDFNYIDQKNPNESVYYQGIQAQEEENGGGAIDESLLPTLYLPVGKKVEIEPQLARRQPLVLGHRLPLQEGHAPGQDELRVLHPAEGRHVPGQVRRGSAVSTTP